MRLRNTAVITLVAVIALGLWASGAEALGLAGFDLYRPGAKNPDGAENFRLKPGESAQARFAIKNTSDAVQHLRAYFADGIPTNNGGITLRSRDDKPRGLAKWLTIDGPPEITLAPGEEREIWYQLKLPPTAEADEQIAGFVVETARAIKTPGNRQFNINLLPRVAILVTQRLPGAAVLRLKIVDFTEQWLKREKVFNLSVKNTGNVHVDPTGRIEIYDMFGTKSHVIKLDKMTTVFPQAVGRSSVLWKDTPVIGYFTAKASVKYDRGKQDTKEITFLIFPWWVLPIVLALWIIAWQQRRKRAIGRLQTEKDRQTEEALESLERTLDEIDEEKQLVPIPSAGPGQAESKSPRRPSLPAKKTSSAKPLRKPPLGGDKHKAVGRQSVKKSPRPATRGIVSKPLKKPPGRKPISPGTDDGKQGKSDEN